MGLISSPSNIASSGDVPFCQPQQLQCLHYVYTKAYLFSPLFLIPFSTTTQVMICSSAASQLRGDLVTAVIAEMFNLLFFCLKRSVKCYTTLKTKHNHPFTVTNRFWGYALSRMNFPYFQIVARIMLSSIYGAVQRGKHTRIQSLLAYDFFINQWVWHPQK